MSLFVLGRAAGFGRLARSSTPRLAVPASNRPDDRPVRGWTTDASWPAPAEASRPTAPSAATIRTAAAAARRRRRRLVSLAVRARSTLQCPREGASCATPRNDRRRNRRSEDASLTRLPTAIKGPEVQPTPAGRRYGEA